MTAVRIERTFPAPPHRLYRAWLDPKVLYRWLAPGGLTVTRVEVDGKVGGHYRIWHAEDGRTVGGFECELVEMVPDERLVFRWGFAGPDRERGPVYDSLLTVTLHGTADGGTRLTLVHEKLEDLEAALPDVAANVGAGWALALDKLAAVEED